MNDSDRQAFLNVLKEEIHVLSHANKLDTWVLVLLLSIYFIMTVFGAFGSALVIHVVAWNKEMRTPRNVFIVNLAISDLTLCLFTQPFNMLRILAGYQEWVLGDFMCKFVSMFQGTNVFVSTISITAIALDRFQVIVYPTRPNVKRLGAIIALFSIWTISVVMATPLIVFSKVSGEAKNKKRVCGEHNTENLIKNSRFAYGIVTIVFQYILPLVITIIAYTRICLRIKHRMVNNQQRTSVSSSRIMSSIQQSKQEATQRRQRKTNTLLLCISIIFALSWLPMNVTTMVLGVREINFHQIDRKNIMHDDSMSTKSVLLIQTICLLLVLCSACANPILYGWLNENFRRQFHETIICSPSVAVVGVDNNDSPEEMVPMLNCDKENRMECQIESREICSLDREEQ